MSGFPWFSCWWYWRSVVRKSGWSSKLLLALEWRQSCDPLGGMSELVAGTSVGICPLLEDMSCTWFIFLFLASSLCQALLVASNCWIGTVGRLGVSLPECGWMCFWEQCALRASFPGEVVILSMCQGCRALKASGTDVNKYFHIVCQMQGWRKVWRKYVDRVLQSQGVFIRPGRI